MADHDIQKSQNLLKDLEREFLFMTELMRQMNVSSHNLNETWVALNVTKRNWRRRVKEEYELD
jgi:hypothetical protein